MKKLFYFCIAAVVLSACNKESVSVESLSLAENNIKRPIPPKRQGPPRILFIGNNQIEYFVSAPTLFAELCNCNNQIVNIDQLITMGVSLDKVYDTNRTEADHNFSNRDKDGNYYDFVILQESTPIALHDLETYRNNLKMLAEKIHKNSPEAAIYVYEGIAPDAYCDSDYEHNYNEMRKNALLAAVFIKNAGILRAGDAVKDAYEGKNGYKYLVSNKDNLRYGKNTLHLINDGGFLQAALLYATLFEKKPQIPKKLLLSTGVKDSDNMRKQEVVKAISNPKALTDIAYNNR